MQSVLIVDDHPLMALATKELLMDIDGIGEIEIAINGNQGIEKAKLYRPDLIIMDYFLTDMTGTEAAQEILSFYPETKILYITGLDINPLLPKMMQTKARGAITKDADHTTIKYVIGCVLKGLTVYPQIVERVASECDVNADLTQEEVNIMKALLRGTTYSQIADMIHMSRRTVDNYMKRIFEKLEARNKTEAVERFMRTKYY